MSTTTTLEPVTPRLSVVVIGYAPAHLLSACVRAIRSQVAPYGDIEVVVVAPAAHQGSTLGEIHAEVPEFRWLLAPSDYNVARMRGLGIAATTGRVIAMIEGDCLPAPDWVDHALSLPAAAATGGAVDPGDFRAAVDWAAYFCEFAKFMSPLPGEVDQLPGANVVYDRHALPDASQLEREGFYETFVNAGLKTADARRYDSGLAVTNHRQWSRFTAMATRFHHGRGYAALRVDGYPLSARIPFALKSLALPAVLVGRVLSEGWRRRRFVGRMMFVLPWIVVLSVSWSVGELAGYVAGAGSSLDQWR